MYRRASARMGCFVLGSLPLQFCSGQNISKQDTEAPGTSEKECPHPMCYTKPTSFTEVSVILKAFFTFLCFSPGGKNRPFFNISELKGTLETKPRPVL